MESQWDEIAASYRRAVKVYDIKMMNIQRLSSFSDGDSGGNPAGVVIAESHPADSAMQAIAAQVGYSETAFAARTEQGWRVRYFSPESEVPFCGHATIALGAALALGVRQLSGDYRDEPKKAAFSSLLFCGRLCVRSRV